MTKSNEERYGMQTQIESVIMVNEKGMTLRVYKIENANTFCIGPEDGEHFEFDASDAEKIKKGIDLVVSSFSQV